MQAAFVLLNLWIGVQFYAFVRHYETGGATLRVSRPAGVALIFAGVVALAQLTGHWQTNVSEDQYRQLIPNAGAFAHPGATGTGR